mgnify:CR=1 FL=1
MKKIHPFNNKVETALRMLCILNEAFPLSFDTQHLIYLDYLSVHSGDVDSEEESLHPPVPDRIGEIFIRRTIIEEGLSLLLSYNLIKRVYSLEGIKFQASETATPFLEALTSLYYHKLLEKVRWVIDNYSQLKIDEIELLLKENIESFKNKFDLQILL